MKAALQWVDGACFMGESGSGHAVVMDGAAEGGGRNLGPRPMELLLLGTAGCTSYDVITILKKARQDVRDCRVGIEAERADEDPKVFTRIHFSFELVGRALKPEVVERALSLSADKYCSASIMLGKTAQITHSYTIREGD
jgi:putative redox protein